MKVLVWSPDGFHLLEVSDLGACPAHGKGIVASSGLVDVSAISEITKLLLGGCSNRDQAKDRQPARPLTDGSVNH